MESEDYFFHLFLLFFSMGFISTPWQKYPSLVELENIPLSHVSGRKPHF